MNDGRSDAAAGRDASDMGADPDELAIVRQALMRELEAINQYQEAFQRARAPEIKALLAHLLAEEKEHMAELTELLKRTDPEQNTQFEAEHARAIRCSAGPASLQAPAIQAVMGLTVGSLLGERQI